MICILGHWVTASATNTLEVLKTILEVEFGIMYRRQLRIWYPWGEDDGEHLLQGPLATNPLKHTLGCVGRMGEWVGGWCISKTHTQIVHTHSTRLHNGLNQDIIHQQLGKCKQQHSEHDQDEDAKCST